MMNILLWFIDWKNKEFSNIILYYYNWLEKFFQIQIDCNIHVDNMSHDTIKS